MDKLSENIKNILIMILCILAFYKFFIEAEPKPIVIETKTVKWDTVKVDSIVYVPKWNDRWNTKWDTVHRDIDTAAILADYFSIYYYSDTIDLDTNGNVVVNDTITQNKIKRRLVIPTIYHKTITNDIVKIINPNEFYLGGGMGTNYLGLEGLYRSNKGISYGIGIGIDNQLNPNISARVLWKLNSKKMLWENL
jgi:hypothetical protein